MSGCFDCFDLLEQEMAKDNIFGKVRLTVGQAEKQSSLFVIELKCAEGVPEIAHAGFRIQAIGARTQLAVKRRPDRNPHSLRTAAQIVVRLGV